MSKPTLLLLAAAAGIAALPGLARAEDPPAAAAPAAAPASPLSFNVGVVSDYRYRGISQSRLKPALQGGADYAFDSGFYLGTWLSTIRWIKDAGKLVTPNIDTGSTPLEWDLYGGYKGDIIKDSLTYDVGGLAYVYVGNKLKDAGFKNANTFEIYGALTYSVVTLKYSYALTDLFGNGGGPVDTKGSGYVDLSANFDLGSGFTLTPHVGHQQVTHVSPSLSYTDYSLTLNKDLGSGFSLSATVQGTDAKKNGVYLYQSPEGKNLGKNTLVVGAKYTF